MFMKEEEKPKNNISIQESHKKNQKKKGKKFRGGPRRDGGDLKIDFKFDLPY
jgi:hypothetical protein